MAIGARFWSAVTYVVSFLTLSPTQHEPSQEPLPLSLNLGTAAVEVVAPGVSNPSISPLATNVIDYPIFQPEGSDFVCEYPRLKGYVFCSKPENRSCWLTNPTTGHTYDINTDYEDEAPPGVYRNYTLVVEDGVWNTDGLISKDMKLINGTYPGPWIQACWGDILNVKVINKLKHNGTAIHFHGVRQNQTMHMDGVPGITQCPIAPNDYFHYNFSVTQYGSSWYHSHYSVQYADGMLGPLTLHGPTTSHWDEQKKPTLMSDWFHNSAFQVIHDSVPGYTTVLLNGTGDVTKHEYRDSKTDPGYRITPNAPIPAKYQLHFENVTKPGRPKRYLMQLINTAFDTTFTFSIDNHNITIVGADFVPVKPAKREFIQVGIGQRYTVIVEANPVLYNESTTLPQDGNFWIRTTVTNCTVGSAPFGDFDQTGILRYNPHSVRDPTTEAWPSLRKAKKICIDERDLVPQLKWTIGDASNGNKALNYGEEFSARRNLSGPTRDFPLGYWAFDQHRSLEHMPCPGDHCPEILPPWNPLQIDYGDPFFLHLHEVDRTDWKAAWMVINEDFGGDDWVYLALTRFETRGQAGHPGIVAHPMHLHGHDFAVLQTEYDAEFEPGMTEFNFTLDNPLRRDVILLPKRGWVVVAFKTDNPGSWIMHCHIAFHASMGLALTINERQKDANKIWPNPDQKGVFNGEIVEANRVCKRWRDFEQDCTRHWPGKDEAADCWPACRLDKDNEKMYACSPDHDPDHVFKDDSGI